jgi:HPt (histidine-containing phosphotransfer) domain-containing protein
VTRDSRPASAPPFDSEALLQRLHGDRTLVAAMAKLLLRELPAQREAVRRAVLARDADGVFQGAHTVAGSAGNFLASDAVEAAQRLERMGRAGELAGADDALAALDDALDRLTPALQELTE